MILKSLWEKWMLPRCARPEAVMGTAAAWRSRRGFIASPTGPTNDPLLAGSGQKERAAWRLFAVIVLGALAVRFLGMGRLELWHDEACSVLTATSPRGVWAELRVDTNAPLYFLLLKGWIQLAGIGAAGVRSLSALCGTGVVAILGLWLRTCGASWRTALCSMALCAVAPMQIYYSQEARPYALVCLLVMLALWTYTRAMKSGRWVDWASHACCVLLGFYTHNVFVLWAVGCWIATMFLGGTRRNWLQLAAAYGVAGLAYMPGGLLLLNQASGSGGTEWIKDYWASIPPALAIPRSLEVLSIGGRVPQLLAWVSMGDVWRVIGLTLVAAAAVACFWPARKTAEGTAAGWREMGKFRWLLVIFTVWPLVDLWAYSLLIKPIYVVGRYDILAQPVYLALLGTGIGRMVRGWRQSSWGTMRTIVGRMATGALGCMMLWGWYQRCAMSMGPEYYPHTLTGELLQAVAEPTDIVVCMKLEGAATMYQCRLRGIGCAIQTVPMETLSHMGWMESDDALQRRQDAVLAQIIDVLKSPSTQNSRHLWVVIPQDAFFPWERKAGGLTNMITAKFFEEAREQGWRELALSHTQPAAVRVAGLERASVGDVGAGVGPVVKSGR